MKTRFANRVGIRPAACPLLADVLLAGAVALVASLVDVFGSDHRSALAPYWDVVVALPLILRRRTPVLAGALIAGLCLTMWLTDVVALAAVFAVLIMLYTLGAWDDRRWLLASALVVAETGVVLAVLQWTTEGNRWLSALMATGTVTAALVIGLYARARRAYVASMLDRAETAERDRDHRARIAVAEERTRMAREMHDIIAHSLAVMITLNDAVAATSTQETVRQTVTQASDVGRSALAELQRMLGVLRSAEPAELTPQPGTAQLSDLIAYVRSTGLTVELTVRGEPTELTATAQLTIYRIVQESLTNVLKHGRNVRRVVVELAYDNGRVQIRVSDDGDHVPGPADHAPGHGLAGMRERSMLYHGDFHAGPVSGAGWQVRAEFELADSEGLR